MTLSNRKSFYSALSRSFKSAQPKLILLASSPRPIRRDADTEYPAYRQSGNVMYLLGNFQISPALIVLRINGVNDTMLPRIDLYLPELTQRESIFSGPYPDFETLKKKFQIDGVYLMKDLVNTFVKDSVLIGSSKEDILETIASNSIAKAALEPLLTLQPDATLLNAFAQARFVKSAEEIQVLRSASRIARWAHHTVEKSIYNDATVNGTLIFARVFILALRTDTYHRSSNLFSLSTCLDALWRASSSL